jgi:hypothetical protein
VSLIYTIKQNDTVPDINASLVEADLSPIDLTSASSVYFIMRASGTVGDPKVKDTCTITDAVNGQVQYLWQTGDTDTAGTFDVEFEIHWGTEIQTVPNDTYITIKIVPDLG